MISDEKQINDFDYVGNDPNSWVNSAEDLLAVSRILQKERENYYSSGMTTVTIGDPIPDAGRTLSAEVMIKGFAIECLLKAIYVSKGNILAKNGKFCGNKVKDHDLIGMTKACGLDPKEKERDLLSRLKVYMTSVGRYPIATSWDHTKLSKNGPPTQWSMPFDDFLFLEMVEFFMSRIEFKTKSSGLKRLV